MIGFRFKIVLFTNICIPSNSSNVDVVNNTWAGHTFAKITFIDEMQITTTIIAGENLPANRFINFYGYLCGSTDKVLGVTTDACNIGEPAKIVTHGIAIVELSSNIITAGEEIRASTDGKATISPLAFQNIINLDSGSAGSLIRVKI